MQRTRISDNDIRLDTAAIARFEALARQHYRQVYLYAYRLTGCRSQAEDLTQETFVRAYRRFATYDPTRPFSNWLVRITHNLFIDGLRGKRQPVTTSLDSLRESDTGDAEMTLQLPDSQYDPMRLLMAETLAEPLESALRGLPSEFRTPILLCDVDGLSYEEIAQALGCTLGTIRSRIHRGRKMLRAVLQPAGPVSAPIASAMA